MITITRKSITAEDMQKAQQVLIDNGIERDEADCVLQALGYVLLDTELYPYPDCEEYKLN